MEKSEYQKLYKLEDAYWWFVGRRRLVATLIEAWMTPAGSRLRGAASRRRGTALGPILDVGCGTGGNLAFLASWGWEAGIDLSPLALDFARRRRLPRLAQASGLALPYAGQAFGLVTAFDMLYHRWVTDDDRVMRECYRVLRPGGWLLVMDSALPGLWSRHDEVFYARQRYTLEEMRRMAGQAGFKLHKLSYANSLLFPVALATRWLGRWSPAVEDAEMQPLPGWLNQILTGVLNLEAGWLRRANFPIGSSLVCLAQKPI